MYKRLLERESLRSEEEVQVFHGYFETPLHQRSSECFPLPIFHFIRARRENMEMVKWIETLCITPQAVERFPEWTCQRQTCTFFGRVKPEDKISFMLVCPAEVKKDEAKARNF